MNISIPIEELYFLMGANSIGFSPNSPFNHLFKRFAQTKKKEIFTTEELSKSLYEKGYIVSTDTIKSTNDVQRRIETVADPDSLYSILTRCYDKLILAEFYEKDGEIVEFSVGNNICYMKEPITRPEFIGNVESVIGETDNPLDETISISIPEYVLLGAAFHLENISDLTGPIEETGELLHFTIDNLKEEIEINKQFDIIDALSALGSGYNHGKLIKAPTLFRKTIEKLILKNYLSWINPSSSVLSVGPAARKLYELMLKPSCLFLTITGSDLKTYDWKHCVTFFWSNKKLFKVKFEKDDIVYTGIVREEITNILTKEILIPVPEKVAEEMPEPEEKKEAAVTKESQILKFCPKCGWKNERGATFCPKCGKTLKRT